MNEYSTKQTQIISLQPYYVSTLPDETKNSTKTANRLLQHSVEPIVPKFTESHSMFVSFRIC